jgi:hypothetical protein
VNLLRRRWAPWISSGLWLSVTAGIIFGVLATGFASVAATEPGEPPQSPERERLPPGFALFALSFLLMPLAAVLAVAFRIHWIGYLAMALQTSYMILMGFSIGGALIIATLPIIIVTAIAMATRPRASRIHT